ncbi:hypothetical protein RQM59_05165 [Flavobacteriaceae bacterium S356]|uniref:Uncharacterized protein n=1 Tax=Asprobacillus argus TaxID=3076534 RepID=A0ABU3LF02_9FLAO|nr:hypothetical protein [Flavobacteriaceae bacterium S356]
MTDTATHKLIQKCLLLIEKKLDWGHSENWHNDVFIELSEKIQVETTVLLSPTTLKRVWGKVNYKSAPSISTLNTLSQFAGYDNWRDFKTKSAVKDPNWFERKIHPNLGIIIPAAAIMTLVFISIYSMTGNVVKKEYDFSKVQFSSHPISNGLPNSVVFDIDLDQITSDSIHIQQFWDETKTIRLKPGQKQATGIYYFPGYFRSKLLVDGQIIREHDLFITSDGWTATVDYEPVPKYVMQSNFLRNELSFSNEILNEIQQLKEPLESSFHYIKDFKGVSGDHITLQSSIKSVLKEKWAVCQSIRIVILGTEGAILIPLSQLGCVSDLNLILNDVFLNGKEHDLSAFGVDLSTEKEVIIKNDNKKVTLFIDGKEMYSNSYTQSIGRFVGFRYRFMGAGTVKNIVISETTDQSTILKAFNE